MFFARLNKANGGTVKDPHHPQNSAKNTTTVKEVPKPKQRSRHASRAHDTSPTKSPGKVVNTDGVKRKKRQSSSPNISSSNPPSPAGMNKMQINTPVESSDEEDEDGFERLKRQKKLQPIVDPDRCIYKDYGDEVRSDLISAAQLVDQAEEKYTPQFQDAPDLEITLELAFGREQYRVLKPKKDDEFNPMVEIDSVMETISRDLVPEKHRNTIKDEMMRDCIVRRMRRSIKSSDSQKFKDSIKEFNDLMIQLRESGEMRETIKSQKSLSFKFVSEILNQVYARVVSPKTQELRHYKAFSNNVYGELLPPFTSKVFHETGMTSKSVFVDLGSGVGNCVLQAALEVGCESWGCEMMKAASSFAEEQQKEVESRIKGYNISMGSINLRSADFVNSPEIQTVLKRADVVLVNNYAFDAKLNGNLIDMFLDLKEGTKIVSLKSFVPPDYVISEANIESPLNILRVETKHFSDNYVSWQANGGKYYISTVDRSQLEKVLNKRSS
jgi:H3 lysine-79-specific histone-lysine N-methyltransferase